MPVLCNLRRAAARALPTELSRPSAAPTAALSTAAGRINAPPMVYISGEEMTRYTAQLMLDKWLAPHVDTSRWEFFDLSCVGRDKTDDQVLHDAVAAGARLCAIFKEPTITPTEVQKEELGLKRAYGSPNGAMRKGWNGITISRDTIHIEGVELGFKEPVLFERHAVGGEYGAGWKTVGRGKLVTKFFPEGARFGACAALQDRRFRMSHLPTPLQPLPPLLPSLTRPPTRDPPPTASSARTSK